MKFLKRYKYFIIFITIFIIIFEFFGYKLALKNLHKFQKTICLEDICINKVKDWVPIIVKVKNENYMFNLINEKFIPFKKEHSLLKNFKNGIVLVKDDSIIKIFSDKEYKFKKNKLIKKYIYKEKIYFVQDDLLFYIIYYPHKKLFLKLMKNETEFLKKFLEIN